MAERVTWLGAEWSEGERGKRGYLLVEVTTSRSQSPHSTASRGRSRHGEDIVAPTGNQSATDKTKTNLNFDGKRRKQAGSKTAFREGG
jgi:hypothetical protein